MALRRISGDEIAKHNKRTDCWIVIHGKVYDVTNFVGEHPGGQKVILQFAGSDGTSGFDPVHPIDTLKILPDTALIGEVDPSSPPMSGPTKPAQQATDTSTVNNNNTVQTIQKILPYVKPPISRILNCFDMEAVARSVMPKGGWDYYSSGADDEITLRENHIAFQRIWLKPRVLVNVDLIDTSCKLLGSPSRIPVYLTACALGKLAHPDGEVGLTRAAKNQGVVHMLPTLASCSLQEMLDAREDNQTQWFQLYVNRDRNITREIVSKAEKGGVKALCITVDAPQLGRREKDMRNKFEDESSEIQKQKGENVNRNQGASRALSKFIDPTLNWEDIKWFQSITSLPIVLKGIQTAEDAILAVKYGAQAIIVSNHGGRQIDYGRSGIEILVEVMDALRSIGAENKLEVYLDGGIRRGTDIYKALALGAKAVGIGRPALYGLAGYGQEGVERILYLLREELEVAMQMMGTPTLADIKRESVITKNLSDHFVVSAKDYLMDRTYIPLSVNLNMAKL